LGGSGRLGTALARELAARGQDCTSPPRAELDLLAGSLEAAIESLAPAAVINASAYNDVDGAEREPSLAYRVNRDAPAAMARACARAGLPFVHVSTDYVFDGRQKRPYREPDPVGPLQTYGRTKLEGERAVLDAYPLAIVARTSTVLGPDRRGGSDYVAKVLRQARAAPLVQVVELPVSCPTYARDLARALLDLLRVGAAGVVHVAGRGSCSRLELAAAAIDLAGLADRVRVVARPAPSGMAARPAHAALDASRCAALIGRPMPHWREALEDYLAASPR
jgi:dTDP-4-dehydrorhamnose reductase